SSDIPISYYPYYFIVFDNSCHSEHVLTDLHDHLRNGRVGSDFWFLILVSNITDPQVKFLAKSSPGMVFSKILAGKASKVQKTYREGIAHHELRRGTGSRSEVIGTGLLFYISIQGVICLLAQKRFNIPGNGNQRVSEVLDKRNQDLDLGGVPTL